MLLKIITLVYCLVGFSVLGLCSSPVKFEDENLKKGIELKLNISDPNQDDLLKLRRLNLTGEEIRSLEGLQYAVNIETLGLTVNQIKNIAPLSKLIKLKALSISDNAIRDISHLSSLSNLEILSLDDNNISDISSLSNLRMRLLRAS